MIGISHLRLSAADGLCINRLKKIAMLAGSHILRVHDVRAAVEARTILEELDKTKA